MANLINISEYKIHEKITTNSEDAFIGQLIPWVSAAVESYCNRKFLDYYNSDAVQYFFGQSDVLDLAHWPVISVSSVERSSNRGIDYETLIEDEDYIVVLEDDAIVTVDGSYFSSVGGPRSVKVTYRGGYEDTDSLPQDLKLAICDIITYYRKNEQIPRVSGLGGSMDNVGIALDTYNWPGHIKRVLDQHRDPVVYDEIY